MLADDNNDRPAWIAAGRVLGHAKALSEEVSEDAHRRVLELNRLSYRTFFDGCIREKNAAFFYGTKDPSMSMEAAAAAHSAQEERNGYTVISTVRAIEIRAIRRVWEAAKWPDDYKDSDPLGKSFSEEERGKLLGLYPGLHRYVEDLDTHGSVYGKRFSRDKPSSAGEGA